MLPLFEYEGKAMFKKYGIPVPNGALWPIEAGGTSPSFPAVVKAQLLEGGRGKRGGIRPVDNINDCRVQAEDLLKNGLKGTPVPHVYIEEKADLAREMYVSISVDRDVKSPVILATPAGGVEVESGASSVERMKIDRTLGLQPYMIRRVARVLGIAGPRKEQLESLLKSMWKMFTEEEALLVEINPLAVTKAGDLIALDSKVGLDDAAAFRHSWGTEGHETGTEFEKACSALGVGGVEIGEGRIAAVMSGAGLMMATLDLMKSMRGGVGWLIDLGGVVFQDATKLTEVVKVVRAVKPSVILFNYSLQVARCDVLASAIAAGFEDVPKDVKVIVRMKGNGSAEVRQILEKLGFFITEDLHEACSKVVQWAR